MKKKWTVPKELVNDWTRSNALVQMRDMYAKFPFGYKKALKCSINSEEIRRCFWRNVKALYPEITKPISYDEVEEYVYISDESDTPT